MKTSLKKFRGFSLHKHDAAKERRDVRPLTKLDELALASQDMQDMRDYYDSLLSAAAATANSAFEFSESLREMGACLLEKTALNDDEEIGKVLLMLGKVQFELQKLVDSYRSHIFQTITSPSESLLNELRTVEEMKRQCDEKKSVYEYMLSRQREKGRSRRGESISPKQLQAALDEYDEEATLFVFRLKSLKSGQSRSLLTQAARHHAAQLHFFKKALVSLEMVEPHVKSVTEQQHINYQFSGLYDDDMKDNENDDDDDDDDEDSDESQGEGELSFDCGQNEYSSDAVSKSKTSMEVDQVDAPFPRVSSGEPPKEFSDRSRRNSFRLSGDTRPSSYSAPLFAENKSDTSERPKQLKPSATRKLYTYVLPTPDDKKGSGPVGSSYVYPPVRRTGLTGSTTNLWHSSPLEQKKNDKLSGDEHLSETSALNLPSVLKESNYNHTATNHVPPPLSETLKSSQFEPHASNTKKIRRYAFSGPLSSKPPLSKPYINDPMTSTEYHRLFSGPISQSRLSRSTASPSTSPPLISLPIISEPHELPRPPVSLTSNYPRSSDVLGHSAPIVLRNRDHTVMNKLGSSASASPLPLPPQNLNMPRSFSIPSGSSRGTELYVSKALEPPNNSPIIEDVSSPPLTPISLSSVVQTLSVTLATTESNQSKGVD